MNQIASRDSQDGLLFGDQFLFDHVAGDLHRGRTGSFATAGLQHVKLAFFDRELDVLEVAVVLLELDLDLQELVVDPLVPLGHFVDVQWRADAGHDVFALGVDEKLAVELVLSRGGVASKGHTRAGIIAHVAEYHRLHVHRGPEQSCDIFYLAILHGSRLHPASEHGLDRQF